MARVIKLKESDIANIVKKVLNEGGKGIWPPKPDRPNVGMAGPPSGSGNPPPHYPDFPSSDMAKPPGGRGEGEKIKVRSVEDVKRVLGNPRSIDEVITNYEKLYNCQPTTKGMPTPDEIARKLEEIEGTTDGDPVVASMWILFGVVGGLMLLLCTDWSNVWPFNSDLTLKENIDLVGKSKSGINIYEFNYINKKYGNGRYRGVMAQEVPSASIIGPEGTLMVDYSKIDVDFETLN